MPRRPSKAAVTSPPTIVSGTAQKRRASARLSASQNEIKRVKSSSILLDQSVKSTAKTSKYFESDNSVESETATSDPSEPEEDDSESAYEEGDPSDATAEEESEPEEPSESEEDDKKSRSRSKKNARSSNVDSNLLKGKELWREGVRTGLGPGKEVFIPKPKARDPGKVPYQDEKLHPNTRLFLIDLTKNNDREWLKGHDPDYRAAKKDFETFVETLTPKIVEKDGTIPELPVKDLIFRIHRDVRFSKNPLPYKNHFSAAWSRTGRKGPYAAYYLHFQPGSSFLGCGLWCPEAEPLAALREDIDENVDSWLEVLGEPSLRREFLNGASDDHQEIMKAFAHANRESALKTKPKGYDADHKSILLLRLRSFTLARPLTDDDLLSTNAQDRISALIEILEPFVTYLNSVVMPDL
ncbi:Uncharacterized protein PECH_002687 [Penicillium ucsense]|uniref:TIGR02453 family protein n=1 Tax=Penicillium ucsense TaxID=2839758 RepID=A0A8J8W6N7_9EURO|nr:Uncharacterized protein PECM_003596 [Penicillium ucsense]KAF7737857.1 Uncharacterized protein PECH_002687 [Penicillium ucsense]